MKITSSIKKWK